MVVEQAAALVGVSVARGLEAAGRELGRAGAEHGALGDEQLVAALAGEVGGAQLDAELGRAAGQDEDVGAGVEVEGLAGEGTAVDERSGSGAGRGAPPHGSAG